jgi:nucleoside-triphosphatase THEP1
VEDSVILLVVGEPGCGKTSWCREYINQRRESGSTAGRILSPAIENQGQRVGSNALDLLTGQEIPFAGLSGYSSFRGGEKVGDYTVSKDGILFACDAIEQAVERRCDPVVIDEVGPLELHGKGVMPAVELALASAVNVLIVIRSSLREALQKRFSDHEFAVIADLTKSSLNTPRYSA